MRIAAFLNQFKSSPEKPSTCAKQSRRVSTRLLLPLAPGVLSLASTDIFAAGPLKLYVATDGNDRWSGALPQPNKDKTDGPFASLARARDEARKRKPTAKHGIEVLIRGGERWRKMTQAARARRPAKRMHVR